MKKTIKSLLISIVLLALVVILGCAGVQQNKVALDDVSSMEILFYSKKINNFSQDKDRKEIKRFVDAYNSAVPISDDKGTTHPFAVNLTLKEGSKVSVLGGTQGFQTVVLLPENKQFNLEGQQLDAFFKQLVGKK